eukprot:scaffold4947_cov160-Amphora_coffeaeformis.AAC.6
MTRSLISVGRSLRQAGTLMEGRGAIGNSPGTLCVFRSTFAFLFGTHALRKGPPRVEPVLQCNGDNTLTVKRIG